MKSISAALRILCGLALIIFSYSTYHRISQHVVAGEPLEAFGVTIGASPGQVTFALGVFALVGVLLIVLGVVTFFNKRA